MKKDAIDYKLYETLHFTPDISSIVQEKIDNAYLQIKDKKIENNKTKYFPALYLGLAASIVLVMGFIGFSNPVMAAKIPFIGRIFNMVETQIGYPGNFSENAIVINSGSYSQTVNGVTITLSEASYTKMALYYSLELYCEEGFPEDFNRVKNMDDYILSYDILNMHSTQSFDFTQADPEKYPEKLISQIIDEGLPIPTSIEGNYINSNTFLGIIRVDLSIVMDILGVDELPPEFIYSFTIDKFWGELNEFKDIEITHPDTGEVSIIKDAINKYYEGPWSFTIPVTLDPASAQTKEINATNYDGVGISTVTKTDYEISAEIILPEGADRSDYIVAITDADGKILDSQGGYAQIYSTYGRNTDTVYIYVVDYYTYMDECKADNAYLLPEKALFQTKVEW
ncbi:MAG: DUF4179 domain-containing protein [Lachnospiraceae bacterium]|nr:DUF4179 domain-containing protein [Lachnospiraceae bacterium]